MKLSRNFHKSISKFPLRVMKSSFPARCEMPFKEVRDRRKMMEREAFVHKDAHVVTHMLERDENLHLTHFKDLVASEGFISASCRVLVVLRKLRKASLSVAPQIKETKEGPAR